ncbi:hypothetical protein ACU4GD_13150 [Cupriavidus basilensis]
MATRAIPEGDGYRLRGVKHFISNANAAGLHRGLREDRSRGRNPRHQRLRRRPEDAGRGSRPAEKPMGIRGGPRARRSGARLLRPLPRRTGSAPRAAASAPP